MADLFLQERQEKFRRVEVSGQLDTVIMEALSDERGGSIQKYGRLRRDVIRLAAAV
jgi:hypothetical protein